MSILERTRSVQGRREARSVAQGPARTRGGGGVTVTLGDTDAAFSPCWIFLVQNIFKYFVCCVSIQKLKVKYSAKFTLQIDFFFFAHA